MTNISKIIKLASVFYSLAIIKNAEEKLPADSKDVDTALKNLENLETFAARKKYAERNFSHLSSGSSRVVFRLTDAGAVVKLAKNEKGFAQNRAEANVKSKSPVINQVKRSSKDYLWIEVDYLDKISPKRFEEIVGIDFEDFGNAIRYALKKISGNTDKKPKDYDQIEKNEIFKDIKQIGKEYSLMPGDLARISSYGEKDHQLKLADVGLTKEVFEKYYDDDGSSSGSEVKDTTKNSS